MRKCKIEKSLKFDSTKWKIYEVFFKFDHYFLVLRLIIGKNMKIVIGLMKTWKIVHHYPV